jgi:hypothetical protein
MIRRFKVQILPRDSNKGIVNSKFEPYSSLLEEMKIINENALNLIQYFDKNTKYEMH